MEKQGVKLYCKQLAMLISMMLLILHSRVAKEDGAENYALEQRLMFIGGFLTGGFVEKAKS